MQAVADIVGAIALAFVCVTAMLGRFPWERRRDDDD